NALFVAISPQTTRQNNFTLQQHGLNYPLLSDPGAAIAEKFGIAYTIPVEHRRYFQSILINIPFNNAGLSYHNATEASWRLPLPAVYVIDRSNTITFAEAHADFRVRPEPADVLAALGYLKPKPQAHPHRMVVAMEARQRRLKGHARRHAHPAPRTL